MRFFTSMHCNCLEQCNCWTTVWIQCSELTKANYADQVFIKHWAHQKISLFEHWWSWTYALAIVVDDDRTPTTEVGRLRCRWCLRRHLGRNRKEGIRKLTLSLSLSLSLSFSLLYRLIIRLWLAVIRSIDRESFFSFHLKQSFPFCPHYFALTFTSTTTTTVADHSPWALPFSLRLTRAATKARAPLPTD